MKRDTEGGVESVRITGVSVKRGSTVININNHGGTNSLTQEIDTITWRGPAVRGRKVAINSDDREANDNETL